MIDVMNTFVAIILSVVALTPIFLLVTLLNRTNVPAVAPNLDPSVIKKLEDMDTTIANDTNNALDQVSVKLEDFEVRIAELEEKSNVTKVKGFNK